MSPPGEAFDLPLQELDDLAASLGPPPWRSCLVGTSGLRVVLLHWPTGFTTVPHLHPGAEEIFQVVRGQALFTIGDDPARDAGPGSFLLAGRGVRHGIRVMGDGPLLLLAVVAPNEDRPDETIEPT